MKLLLKHKIYLATFILATLFSCNKTEEKSGFTITATIENASGTAKLLKLNLVNNETIVVDSTNIENGKFTFKGNVESPYFHTVMLNEDRGKRFHFFLENSNINVNGNYNDIENVTISGSKENDIYKSYDYQSIFEKPVAIEIMKKHNNTSFGAFTAFYQFQVNNFPLDSIGFYVNNFSPEVKKSVYFKHLDSLYITLKRVAISQKAPNFSIPNTEQKIVNLSDFKGKYVLIDFWASWCVPCRKANPTLVNLYKNLKDQNFEIISISVDKNRKSWLKAIEDDGLTWTNLSNVKGWDKVSKNYGVKAIPQNFLLNPKGVIIAKNIAEDDMIETVRKLIL